MNRSKKIIQTSIVGIIANLVLVAFKATIGMITGSVAIVMDAVNNLSDALSSVITILGTKLAGKSPDKKHPYGYGRIEYITSVTIAVIVLLAGVSSFIESFERIMEPSIATYSPVSLLIIVAAVFVKYILGRFVKSQGKRYNSDALIASGTDAVFDSIISLSTLLAAFVSIAFHISIEGYLGVVIAVVIVKSGTEILMDSIGSIIGKRIESELVQNLKSKIQSYPKVDGVYDLVLHQYGPEQFIGSVHIEVDDNLTAKEIHKLTRAITTDVYMNYAIVLTVGIYASNTDTNEFAQMKNDLKNVIASFPEVLQMHGFYVENDVKVVTFDLIVDFSVSEPSIIKEKIVNHMSNLYSEYTFYVVLDKDFSI